MPPSFLLSLFVWLLSLHDVASTALGWRKSDPVPPPPSLTSLHLSPPHRPLSVHLWSIPAHGHYMTLRDVGVALAQRGHAVSFVLCERNRGVFEADKLHDEGLSFLSAGPCSVYDEYDTVMAAMLKNENLDTVSAMLDGVAQLAQEMCSVIMPLYAAAAAGGGSGGGASASSRSSSSSAKGPLSRLPDVIVFDADTFCAMDASIRFRIPRVARVGTGPRSAYTNPLHLPAYQSGASIRNMTIMGRWVNSLSIFASQAFLSPLIMPQLMARNRGNWSALNEPIAASYGDWQNEEGTSSSSASSTLSSIRNDSTAVIDPDGRAATPMNASVSNIYYEEEEEEEEESGESGIAGSIEDVHSENDDGSKNGRIPSCCEASSRKRRDILSGDHDSAPGHNEERFREEEGGVEGEGRSFPPLEDGKIHPSSASIFDASLASLFFSPSRDLDVNPDAFRTDIPWDGVPTLFNSHWGLEHARPLMPYEHMIGHTTAFATEASKPIPPEIDDWLRVNPGIPVVYVALGTMAIVSPSVLSALSMAMASSTNFRFLWSVKRDQQALLPQTMREYSESWSQRSLSAVSEEQRLLRGPDSSLARAGDIFLVDWAPQLAVLMHNMTAIFLTHGGMNGVAEGTYAHTPMLCVPFFSDQPDNCQHMEDYGFAIRLNPARISNEAVRQALNALAGDWGQRDKGGATPSTGGQTPFLPPSANTPAAFRAAVQRAWLRNVAAGGIPKAVQIIESTADLGYGDFRNNIPLSQFLPWWQRLGLDVALVWIAVLLAIMGGAYLCVRCICCRCCCCGCRLKSATGESTTSVSGTH